MPDQPIKPSPDDIEEAREWLDAYDHPSVEDLARFRAEARVAAEAEAEKLRAILRSAPDWNCDPSNDCHQECYQAWLATAEAFGGSPPKHVCRRCKSECLPFQLFDNLCRWCALREAKAEERRELVQHLREWRP